MILKTFALWLTLVAPAALQPTSSELDDWPYVVKERGYAEQSPVDISTQNAQRRFLPFLRYFGYFTFDNSVMNITNNGHTVCVTLSKTSEAIPFVTGGPLFDDKYEFVQMHFHWGKYDLGSEHKVNGFQYAMEIHMVHFNTAYGTFQNAVNYSDGVCVIAFFGQISTHDNEEMANFIADLKYLTQPGSSILRPFKEEFSFIKRTALKQHYYAYHGSLTTEPFSECVIWIIFTKPIKISRSQLKEFRHLHSSHHGVLINENDRPLQSFNGRPIVYGY
ncbi:carbonic anhydrase 7-like [Adelges cooleyi]|uniref:carbonic anhydrase 7-like n=1 Tax=Adelges cooleyi TaxID=133065 RepID=UPI00217FAF5E|nr:carbonic anhydrase 7-like [Adelges cooleyi]